MKAATEPIAFTSACDTCGSDGMIRGPSGHLAICVTCGGSGRRLRSSCGDQPDDFEDLRPAFIDPGAH